MSWLESSGRPDVAQIRACYWVDEWLIAWTPHYGMRTMDLTSVEGREESNAKLGSDGGRAAGLEDPLYPSFLSGIMWGGCNAGSTRNVPLYKGWMDDLDRVLRAYSSAI